MRCAVRAVAETVVTESQVEQGSDRVHRFFGEEVEWDGFFCMYLFSTLRMPDGGRLPQESMSGTMTLDSKDLTLLYNTLHGQREQAKKTLGATLSGNFSKDAGVGQIPQKDAEDAKADDKCLREPTDTSVSFSDTNNCESTLRWESQLRALLDDRKSQPSRDASRVFGLPETVLSALEILEGADELYDILQRNHERALLDVAYTEYEELVDKLLIYARDNAEDRAGLEALLLRVNNQLVSRYYAEVYAHRVFPEGCTTTVELV